MRYLVSAKDLCLLPVAGLFEIEHLSEIATVAGVVAVCPSFSAVVACPSVRQ